MDIQFKQSEVGMKNVGSKFDCAKFTTLPALLFHHHDFEFCSVRRQMIDVGQSKLTELFHQSFKENGRMNYFPTYVTHQVLKLIKLAREFKSEGIFNPSIRRAQRENSMILLRSS